MSSLESKSLSIANRLRIAREQAGLSQGQVARMLGIHRPSVSESEAGRRKVSAEELAEYARIYGVSIDWLACLDTNQSDANQDRIELAARELAKMSKDDLGRLLDLLSTLKQDKQTD